MSAAPSLKELVKAVGSFVQVPHLPLPDDLVEIIEAFLLKYIDRWDESIAEKVHDELLSLFKQDIAQEPARYAAFLAVLRRLRPLIGQPERVSQWFDLLLPVLTHLTREANLASESQGIVLDVLTSDDGNGTSSFTGGAAAPVAEKIILLWFREVGLLQKGPDALQDFKEKHLKETLLLYGKKRPKDFMAVVNQFVCKKSHRASSLLLLSAFVQSRPPHLHLILQTPLFDNLLICLQRDTSTTIISLALTVFIMVLPHVPSSLVLHLPTLFNIYARLLFWERELSVHVAEQVEERMMSSNTLSWEACQFASDSDGSSVPQVLDYFTILYGLYPINFMDYIRKPQRYLRHAEAPDADVIEVQPSEIRHASERFRQCHILHENFYTLTIDSEKTDFGRFIKSEPAELVADCMALRQSPDEPLYAVPVDLVQMVNGNENVLDIDGREPALLDCTSNAGIFDEEDVRRSADSSVSQLGSGSQPDTVASRHHSQSGHQSKRDSSSPRRSESENDSPTMSRQLTTSSSQTQLQDLMNSNKAVKSSMNQSSTSESGPSLTLSPHESIPEKSSSQLHFGRPGSNLRLPDATANEKHKKLLRYVYLLYNDLIFERFLKQQHLTHIGELKRRHVQEAASEAETQNIINVNKHLKQRLEEAKKAEIQAKTEAEKSRTLAKKWEADMINKLKVLREEQKKWNTEGLSLRVELKAAKKEADELRAILCEVEVRELKLKQNMESADINFGELERLRSEVARLTASERIYQAKEAERQAAMTQATEADSRAQAASMKLAACEADFRHTCDLYQSQIASLNSRLQDLLKTDEGRKTERIDTQLSAALEASRIAQSKMTARINELLRENNELQATNFEMRSEISSRSKPTSRQLADSEDDASSNSRSTSDLKNPRHPSISESEVLGATSFNPTPPLEPPGTTEVSMRPSTPFGAESSSMSRSTLSPTTERCSSRGRTENPRKSKKEKKEDKERRKLTGLRGIRGFV
ncbi:hypothetical protein GGS21DRAFT_531902 [Xylaria nigripes]|nr:hypothetical protein GGS21DRAFT_531902 [Xylaria nigripes]